MRTIKIRGMSFRVIERPGKGKEAILLINGMRMEQGVYNLLRRELNPPTISFDFPRVWIPSWRWYLSPMWDFAHVVSILITALEYERVDILGVSWGGALAIEFAALYPEQVRKLVLVSTTARPFRHFTKVATLLAYAKRDYGGKARSNPAIIAETKTTAGRSPIFTDLYRGVALPFWLGDVRLRDIQSPTLIVSGHDDSITPLEEARWLLQIPDSRLELVDDGHLAIFSSADEVAGFVNPFLMAI